MVSLVMPDASQNVRIDHDNVPRGMGDADGVIGRGLVEVMPVGMAAQRHVVIAAAGDQQALRSPAGFLLQRRNQLIHVLDLVGTQPGRGVRRIVRKNRVGMQMDIVESRRDRLASEIDHLRRRDPPVCGSRRWSPPRKNARFQSRTPPHAVSAASTVMTLALTTIRSAPKAGPAASSSRRETYQSVHLRK